MPANAASASAKLLVLARANLWVILLAILVGAIYAGPDVYHAHTPGYQGILITGASDSEFYLSNINKSYELTGLLGNPYLYEYRDARNTFQYFLVELVVGKVGAALHAPIDTLAMVMEFVLPLLLTLVVYAFAFALSRNMLMSFFISGAMLLGNEIVHPDGISNLFNTFLMHGRFVEFLSYSRPVNPQASALFFYATLASFLYLFRNPHLKKAMILAGLALGLLLYLYIYFWAFAFALLGVIFLYALVVRAWPLLVSATVAGVVSAAVIAPYAIINFLVLLHGQGGGLTQAIPTHQPIIEKMILVPLFFYVCVYLYVWWSGGKGRVGEWAARFAKKYQFVLLLLITGVVVSNQQVLTGRSLFQEHFHFFTNIPLFLFSMSILAIEVLAWFPRLLRVGAITLGLLVFVWFAIGVQVASFNAHSADFARNQMLSPIYTYLREHSAAQSVVLADGHISDQLTMYTQDFVYSSGVYDTNFQVPQERILHNYFVTLALRGITPKTVRAYVYDPVNRNEIGYTIFTGTYWRDLCGSGGCFPDSVLEDIIEGYNAFYAKPLITNLKKYKINYVLLDHVQDAQWNVANITAGAPIITSGDYALYLIR